MRNDENAGKAFWSNERAQQKPLPNGQMQRGTYKMEEEALNRTEFSGGGFV